MYDVIIVGAGPAGVSASLYTKRAGKDTLIIYSGKSSLEKTEKIDNYYGFENGISGAELYNNGIKQAENLGIEVKNEEILKIEPTMDKTFMVHTTVDKYEAKSIIMAVGQKRRELEVKGASELEGKGVSYCAICDGFFYRNKDVAVIGSGDYAVSETNDLINLANKITILTNGENAPDIRADNVEVITKNIKEISGENKVESVVFEDDTELKADGVFIAQGNNDPTALAKKLGLILKNNRILVDEVKQGGIFGSIIFPVTDESYDIITKEETQIILIDFERITDGEITKSTFYNQFIKNLLKIITEVVLQRNERIELLTQKSIRDKLLQFFKLTAEKNGSRTFKLPFSLTELSEYLSVDRSAMSRELKNLKDEGFIKIVHKRVTLLYSP